MSDVNESQRRLELDLDVEIIWHLKQFDDISIAIIYHVYIVCTYITYISINSSLYFQFLLRTRHIFYNILSVLWAPNII